MSSKTHEDFFMLRIENWGGMTTHHKEFSEFVYHTDESIHLLYGYSLNQLRDKINDFEIMDETKSIHRFKFGDLGITVDSFKDFYLTKSNTTGLDRFDFNTNLRYDTESLPSSSRVIAAKQMTSPECMVTTIPFGDIKLHITIDSELSNLLFIAERNGVHQILTDEVLVKSLYTQIINYTNPERKYVVIRRADDKTDTMSQQRFTELLLNRGYTCSDIAIVQSTPINRVISIPVSADSLVEFTFSVTGPSSINLSVGPCEIYFHNKLVMS